MAKMRGNAGVPGCPHQWFSFFERDMVPGFMVFVPFRQPKIYDINSIFLIPFTDHKIVCLEITMKETFAVDGFEMVENLESNIVDSGNGQFSATDLEKIFERFIE